jgi:hypothetical protein
MFESETQLLLKMVLEQLSKKFSPIFNSLRVPLAISIGERKNKRRSKANYVAAAFSDSFFLVKSLLFNKIKGKNIKSVSQKFVFVIDHNREPFINLFLEILRAIPANDVCIFTINRSIYKRLIKDNVYKVIYINNLTNFNLKVVNSLRKVDSEIINIDRAMPIFDRISVFTDILKVVCYENFYEKILSNDICSVVTLCDANLHEQVITRVANKKCVSTYTLQHGMINMLWFPIVSNYFFVWNKHTKEICNKKYGVNDSQMIITGNPFIEAQEIDRIQNNVFTITYIVTNWGEIENKKLFKIFLKISNIKNIKIIVKLRPNSPHQMLSLYNSWMSKTERDNIQIIYENDIKDVLSKTDLIVTFHSGVPVDAMAYNIPSILLDVFDYIDLKELIGHYDDCVVVNSVEDYIKIVSKIVRDKGFYNDLVKEVIISREKHFLNITKNDTIKLITNNIIHNEGKGKLR